MSSEQDAYVDIGLVFCYRSSNRQASDDIEAWHRKETPVRIAHGSIAVGTALALASAAFLTSGSAKVSAQECHYAYGGCLPYVDDINCTDIGSAVLEVWDVYDDPYRLDDAYGPGNGWTCDGVG
jgi:hypothetical protein